VSKTVTIILASGDSRTLRLGKPLILIGRTDDCDVRIESQAVSRRHAELTCREDGVWEIRDLGSLNCVLVNNRPVESARVSEGDEILIGDARLYLGTPPADDSTVRLVREARRGLWLDPNTRCLRREQEFVGERLGPLEYALLRLLAQAGGQVVERSVLEETLWGADAYDDNALHQLVRRTREKIHDNPKQPEVLLTLPGVGYRLNLGAERPER
jgi:hypothetical protein